MNEVVQPYASALTAVALSTLLVLVQSFHSTFVNFIKSEKNPSGMPVEGTYSDQHWRIYRVHQNSMENFSAFAAAVFAAVLVGVSAGWLAILAWVYLAARVAHWVLYVMGIGPAGAGPRTIAFVVAFFSTGIIAVLVVFTGLF